MAWIKFWCSQWLLSAGRFAFTPEEKSLWFDMLAMAGENANPGEIWYPNIDNFSIRIAQEPASLKMALLKFHNSSKIIWIPNENRIIILNWDKFQSGKMSHCQATKDFIKEYEECGHLILREIDAKNCKNAKRKQCKNGIENTLNPASPIDKIRSDKKRDICVSSYPDDLESLFLFYEEKMGTKIKRTDGRKAKLMLRLKTFSADEIKQAIQNVSQSPFHMGDNDRHIKYNSIDMIIRADEQTEKYLHLKIDERLSEPYERQYHIEGKAS